LAIAKAARFAVSADNPKREQEEVSNEEPEGFPVGR